MHGDRGGLMSTNVDDRVRVRNAVNIDFKAVVGRPVRC